MRREITSWYSERLYDHMPLVAYGHAGYPILMLPTAAADFLEYERFQMIHAIHHHIEAGRVRAYSVNSVNRQSLLNDSAPPPVKAELLSRYDGYLTQEVLPLIRQESGDPGALPLVFGISLGAYLAGNLFFRHPDLFGGCILMAGSYDIRQYMGDYYDDNVYFNNPVDYLPKLDDGYQLPILQSGTRRIIIFTGQGRWEAPERSYQLARILESKGIPHWLDVWGYDVDHDWPWWRVAMNYYIEKLFT